MCEEKPVESNYTMEYPKPVKSNYTMEYPKNRVWENPPVGELREEVTPNPLVGELREEVMPNSPVGKLSEGVMPNPPIGELSEEVTPNIARALAVPLLFFVIMIVGINGFWFSLILILAAVCYLISALVFKDATHVFTMQAINAVNTFWKEWMYLWRVNLLSIYAYDGSDDFYVYDHPSTDSPRTNWGNDAHSKIYFYVTKQYLRSGYVLRKVEWEYGLITKTMYSMYGDKGYDYRWGWIRPSKKTEAEQFLEKREHMTSDSHQPPTVNAVISNNNEQPTVNAVISNNNEPLAITVTQDHIAAALVEYLKHDSSYVCPIAQACRDIMKAGMYDIKVGATMIYRLDPDKGGYKPIYKMPIEAIHFVEDFDLHRPVYPFEFVAQPYTREDDI